MRLGVSTPPAAELPGRRPVEWRDRRRRASQRRALMRGMLLAVVLGALLAAAILRLQ